MTIAYLGEITVDTSDLADLLRGDDEHDVFFFSSAYQVHDWAEDADDKIVVYETAFASEAEQLKNRFVLIERKPDMDDAELFDAIELAGQKLSTRIQQ